MHRAQSLSDRRRPFVRGALLLVLLALLSPQACTVNGQDAPDPLLADQNMRDYWFSGQAELTRYELEQARYGEIHRGDAVLIFVTEEFLPDLQVKYEHGPGVGRIPILKLNFTKQFNTGIYPYSLMTSIFTPFGSSPASRTLKTSMSGQEWCGHVYTQFNLDDDEYRVRAHSYFQDEADQDFRVPAALLEDEIWTRLRLNPESLPTGSIEIIPATQYLRLRHLEPAVVTANATRTGAISGTRHYRLEYTNPARTLDIEFEAEFPYAIVGWTETFESGWGDRARVLTTKARRTHTLRQDYWNHNRNADRVYRTELGL